MRLTDRVAPRAYRQRVDERARARAEAQAHAAARGGALARASVLVIDGNPGSKQRPRLGRYGVYKPDADAERALAWEMLAQRTERYPQGELAMLVIFYRRTRHRVDADNLLKRVCDAGNGVLWGDDSQFVMKVPAIEYDAARPRTVLVVGEFVRQNVDVPPTGGQDSIGKLASSA